MAKKKSTGGVTLGELPQSNSFDIKSKIARLPMVEQVLAPVGQQLQPVALLQWLPHEDLQANDYNPNNVAIDELELLKRSLLEEGWTQPIVAYPIQKARKGKPQLEIIDGFHRWSLTVNDPQVYALTDGLVPVSIVEGKSKTERMLATIRHNRARGTHGIVHMANIVKHLVEIDGLTREDLILRLGMDGEEVDRLLIHSGMPKKVFGENSDFSSAWKPISHEEAKRRGI